MLGFVVAFAAGLMTGVRSHTAPSVTPTSPSPLPPGPGTRPFPGGPRGQHSFLTRELSLTPDQQDKLKEIWSKMAILGPREQDELRRQYRNERDEAIAALIHTEDLAAYDKILKAHSDKLAVLDQQFRDAYQAAVESTKQILTPEQRAKYEEILKRNQAWDQGPRGGPRRGGDRPPPPGMDEEPRRAGDRATTRPADR
jgi:Spy/CpxP family protein refolding chaperone